LSFDGTDGYASLALLELMGLVPKWTDYFAAGTGPPPGSDLLLFLSLHEPPLRLQYEQ
jgi:hypothetical protein